MKNPFQSNIFPRFREKLNSYLIKHPLRTGLPVLAVAGGALAAVVVVTSCTVCYTISSNGERVAFCSDTATLDKAIVQAENRAAAILNRPYSFDEDAVSVRTTVAPKQSLEEVAGVTDSLLDAIPEIEHVYTLTVDGAYVGANENPAVLENAVNEVKSRYETKNTVSLHVDNEVSIQCEYLPAEKGTLSKSELVDALLAETPTTFSYTVQEGDDPVSVAENFGLTLARLQELNPETDLSVYTEAESILNPAQEEEQETEEKTQQKVSPYAALASVAKPGEEKDSDPYAALASAGAKEDTEEETQQTISVRDFLTEAANPLEAGQTLTIEQSCPLLQVTTVEETAFIRTLEPERQEQVDESLFAGQERIIQEGSAGYADVVARQERRCGVLTASTDLSVETTSEPVPVIVATGSQPLPNTDSGNGLFQWPVRGHISSDFGYRYIFGSTSFHRGVDIAASMGTPICAAEGGTVVFTGVRGTYGNLVVISHPSGLYTYYGHCSEIYAQTGDTVLMGDVIAAVGSTGRSTGPHCHFEVRYENAPIDPLQFLPDENNAPMRSVPITATPTNNTASSTDSATTSASGGQSSSTAGSSTTGSRSNSSSRGTSFTTVTPVTPVTPAASAQTETPAQTEEPATTPETPAETTSPIYSVTGPNLFSGDTTEEP